MSYRQMRRAKELLLPESEARAFGWDARAWKIPPGVSRVALDRALVSQGAIDVVFGEQWVVAFFPAHRATRTGHQTHFSAHAREPKCHQMPIRYDGVDLEEVARATGLTVSEIVRIHSHAEYAVTMVGFAPGFAYLRGLDERLHLPRRATPRPRVQQRTLAIGGPYSGIYPSEMPGGWNLVGTYLGERLFDLQAGALLRVDDRVAFHESDRASAFDSQIAEHAAVLPAHGVEVVNVAGVASIQDHGRAGVLSMGLARGGYVAPSNARAVNSELENDPSAACIEGFGRITLRARETVRASFGGESVDLHRGDELTVEATSERPVYYVGVHGGFAVPSVLGGLGTQLSCALGGYAGRGLRRGDVIGLASQFAAHSDGARADDSRSGSDPRSSMKLTLTPSPYEDDEEWAQWLAAQPPLSVRVDVRERNRVGIPVVLSAPVRVLPTSPAGRSSRPMRPGAVQVTPSGRIFVLGPEHPTIGGYPLLGVVNETDLERLYLANGSRVFELCAGRHS